MPLTSWSLCNSLSTGTLTSVRLSREPKPVALFCDKHPSQMKCTLRRMWVVLQILRLHPHFAVLSVKHQCDHKALEHEWARHILTRQNSCFWFRASRPYGMAYATVYFLQIATFRAVLTSYCHYVAESAAPAYSLIGWWLIVTECGPHHIIGLIA